MSLIDKAIEFAVKQHNGQYRDDSNLPYVVHVIDVLRRVSFLGIRDENILCSAVLHDVIEDCGVLKEDIEKEFNLEIANVVQELSRPEEIKGFENKKMYLDEFAESVSESSLLIKFCDRISNVENYFVDGKRVYSLKYFHQANSVIFKLLNTLSKDENKKSILELVYVELKKIDAFKRNRL